MLQLKWNLKWKFKWSSQPELLLALHIYIYLPHCSFLLPQITIFYSCFCISTIKQTQWYLFILFKISLLDEKSPQSNNRHIYLLMMFLLQITNFLVLFVSFIRRASSTLKECHYVPLRKVNEQMNSTSAKWECSQISGTILKFQNSLWWLCNIFIETATNLGMD